ncbi:Formimidoylglutamase [Geobacillus sp. BCO2]|nr:Formimidoylglutamase [Geobacillus sp. BCO2]
MSQPLETAAERAAAFIGFACDEGVRRNQGRQGAKEAPAAVKAALARLPWHLPEGAAAYDAGDVVCVDGHLEQSQAELGIAIARLLQHNMAPIVIGGGHETAYGHYLGVREALGTDARLGISTSMPISTCGRMMTGRHPGRCFGKYWIKTIK